MKQVAAIMIVLASLAAGTRIAAAAGLADACGWLTRAEIQHAIGGTAAGFDHPTTFRGGSTSLCQGQVSGATVTVRVSAESKEDSANERAIAQMIRTRLATGFMVSFSLLHSFVTIRRQDRHVSCFPLVDGGRLT